MTPAEMNRRAWGFVQGFAFITMAPIAAAIIAILLGE